MTDADNSHAERKIAKRTPAHIHRGWTIAPNGDEWAYRKHRHEMWAPAFTVAEAKAAIDLLEAT